MKEITHDELRQAVAKERGYRRMSDGLYYTILENGQLGNAVCPHDAYKPDLNEISAFNALKAVVDTETNYWCSVMSEIGERMDIDGCELAEAICLWIVSEDEETKLKK